ncbi:uncharacterized protein MAM_06715 [Metarhizium album ARSEF 1941]|uniref:Uncharacterized protein n=1 Tax=Metarhizium album (strain ARSEF 1941) TaxID=1081103 RepID=A0A0B2WNB4_METAS|nr:uncharacterized protein MAM_06715 [Metarhizium album ARSEF 1941]KHN95438.1 hypothetical protein MAM_06715 [Metarhizium album ARSEF 1941]
MCIFAAGLLGISLAFLPFFALAAPSQSCSPKKPITRERQKQIKDDYLALWCGDYSRADKVLSPGVTLNIDRHPTADGSAPVVVNNSSDFMNFLRWSRTGWEKFNFKVVHWAADGHHIAIRWKLEAVMGTDYCAPTSLKPGDVVSYNGTDFLVLNECTGLVDEVNIAQDMMNLFHALELFLPPHQRD